MAVSPRRLAPAARRAQILDAALPLLADADGEVGLEELAAAAGVTRNLLYRYFDSRAALQRAAVEEALRRTSASFDVDPGRAPADKRPRNVRTFLDWFERDDPALRLLLRAAAAPDPEVAAVGRDARRQLVAAIARNNLGGAEPPPPLMAAIDAYLALAERLIAAWRHEGALTREQVEAALVAVLGPLVAATGAGATLQR